MSVAFTKPQPKCKWWDWLVFAAIYFLWNAGFISMILGDVSESSTEAMSVGVYTGIGVAAVIPALVEDFISNGICEELFFRGFLCKRLSGKFGIVAGLILQAIAFGLLHNLLYIFIGVEIGIIGHLMLFIGTSLSGIAFGILNERIFGGSIIPSILLHGIGNFSSSISEAFGWDNKFGVYSAYIVIMLSIVIAMIKRKKAQIKSKLL